MNAKVLVSAQARLCKKDDDGKQKQLTMTDARNAVGQAVEDAVHGTFGALVTRGIPAPDFEVTELRDLDGGTSRCEFRFDLPATMFPIEAGGLQHLIGVLCGDTFRAPSGGVEWSEVKFTNIKLPDSLRDSCRQEFGQFSYDVASIRAHFNLDHGWPLLAFTYKPRVGVPYPTVRLSTLDVLREGFNLVEPDTRRITTPAELDQWAGLGRDAAKVRPGKTAFAPNLTLPADMAVPAARRWRELCPDGPFVVKVDGGLDGLSTIQALRRAFRDDDRPVVTCYPLVGGELARLPKGFLADTLIRSGADIIYPGGRPDFSGKVRAIDADRAKMYGHSASTYDRIIEEMRKMPTFAGGAHPADLHVANLLLGPNTGFFLGGAVALHSDGPRAGAKVCYKIIEAAVKQGKRDLKEGLVKEIESKYTGRAAAGYFPPRLLFDISDNTHFPPKPYGQRAEYVDAGDDGA